MLPDLKSADNEQDLLLEKDFARICSSDLKGLDDGHCIVYGHDSVYKFMENIERGSLL